jgi:hypothetical protein
LRLETKPNGLRSRLADERDPLVAQGQQVGRHSTALASSTAVLGNAVRRVDQHGREVRTGEPFAFVCSQREREMISPSSWCRGTSTRRRRKRSCIDVVQQI